MSAADVVLGHRYRTPRVLVAVDAGATPDVQAAQYAIATGLARAENEMRSVGFSPATAQHLTRMAALMFLSAFDAQPQAVSLVFDALVDRINREGWISRVGG